jgi:glycosyltransferase involved in cell wall biosynthesis
MRLKLCVLVRTHWAARMGGSQYQAKVLIDYLLEHYDVDIVWLTTCADPSFTPTGYRIVTFSDPGGLRRYGSFFDAVRLYRALARERPDVILQFVGCAHTGIAALYARRHGCKMVWRVTNDPSVEPQKASWLAPHRKLERLFLNFGIRNATLVVAQTEYQRARLAEAFPNAPVQVLPNFHPAPPDCGRDGAVVRQVTWIANFKPLKNPGAFVRLARRFAHRSDVRFVMVGGAPAGEWAKQQLAAIAATPNVDYRGALSQSAVNSLLEETDLLVNTSDHEGFSNTFIQAWMRRVPVVSLRVDPDRLLSRGGLGAVAGGDEEQLYDSVASLLDDPDRRAAIGARARRYALEHHAESNIETLARLLDLERWLTRDLAAPRLSR